MSYVARSLDKILKEAKVAVEEAEELRKECAALNAKAAKLSEAIKKLEAGRSEDEEGAPSQSQTERKDEPPTGFL